MTPFKLPVTTHCDFLHDADGQTLGEFFADEAEQNAIVQAINNTPIQQALAEYYAANEALAGCPNNQTRNRFYEARRAVQHLLEKA